MHVRFSSQEFFNSIGRKRPLKTVDFEHSERPLSGKADIQPEACEIGSTNDL